MRFVGLIVFLAGLAGAGLAALFFAADVMHWLRFGGWPGYPVRAGLDYIGVELRRSDWVGLQLLLDYALAAPLWIALALGAVVLMPFGRAIVDDAERSKAAAPPFPWREWATGLLFVPLFLAGSAVFALTHALHPALGLAAVAALVIAFVLIVRRGRRQR